MTNTKIPPHKCSSMAKLISRLNGQKIIQIDRVSMAVTFILCGVLSFVKDTFIFGDLLEKKKKITELSRPRKE